MNRLFAYLKSDLVSGLTVALVALPLCLGIALASGAPLISGLVAGIVGGIVIGYLSGSHTSVSGPAAGLTVIVLDAISNVGSYSVFLVSVVIAGGVQIFLAWLGLGTIANFVPIAVIQGMLASIGIVIILKQIPHALGRDHNYIGDFSFFGSTNSNTLQELYASITYPSLSACIITAVSFVFLLKWDSLSKKVSRIFRFIPASLVVVGVAVGINEVYRLYFPTLHLPIGSPYLVSLPAFDSIEGLYAILPSISHDGWWSPMVWKTGLTVAVVASLETLLSVEAADKLDPQRRLSPPNKELFAQGVGNIISGFLGGLPVTSVVVRTSANVYSGARSKLSTIVHGVLLLGSLITIPHILNRIPLSALAAVLLMVGYKLCSPRHFKTVYSAGWDQFVPFVTTIVAVVFTDLLTGVVIGIAVGLFYVIRTHHADAFTLVKQDKMYLLKFNKEVTFINKTELKEKLFSVPPDSSLIIDIRKESSIDFDIRDVLLDFKRAAAYQNISIEFNKCSVE